jgi:acetylornithine/succinyldiaminopimelate/putrescine aminotransferase
MDAIEEPELLRSVRTLGEYLREAVAELPHVVSVRGRGLMVGIDLQAQLFAPDIVACALSEQRLLLNATGPSTLRLLPPLILSREDADEVIRRLGNVLRGQ